MAANSSLPDHLAKSKTLVSLQGHSKKLQNPLEGVTREELADDAAVFAAKCDVESEEEKEIFVRAALLAAGLEDVAMDAAEVKAFGVEKQWWKVWLMSMFLLLTVLGNAMAAVVQGMDETVINGAQVFFLEEFGIEDRPLITGLVIGAPYLCCALLGCWLSDPLNKYFGRRWAVFISMVITVLASFGQAVTTSWQQMLAARVVLGLGVGISSSTVPVYSSECAPTAIRGALTMQWQVFTAMGIMLGNAVSLMFYQVPDQPGIQGFRWRLMMAAPAVPSLFVCIFVFWCPESPRWLMSDLLGPPNWWPTILTPKRGVAAAYRSMRCLRKTRLQAARDCYLAFKQIEAQEAVERAQGYRSLWKVKRNRRALYASQTVMIFQQLCGINVVAYYSSKILVDAGFARSKTLYVSFGLGLTNFLFALPAMSLIDKFGRRSLLLATTPFMAAFLALTGASFNLQSPDPGLWVTIAGLFLFVIAYSPGGGPVPFTYCAEAWPLQVRTLGMGVNTATTWLFNFLISFTFPRLVDAMGQQGVFYLYCGLNCMLQLLVWLFVPETKALSLEALDVVFATPTAEHISANWQKLAHRRGRKQTTYLERDGDVVVPWSGKIEEEVQVYETTTRSSDAT